MLFEEVQYYPGTGKLLSSGFVASATIETPVVAADFHVRAEVGKIAKRSLGKAHSPELEKLKKLTGSCL